MSENILKYIKDKAAIVDAELDKYLSNNSYAVPGLLEAMRYSVFNGGKRIRPILAIATAEVLKQDVVKVLPIACAVEMIHSYSLIHDDLPAMDDDDFRRGKLTCHKQYDEATAILAGDTLQAYAYEVLSKGLRRATVDNQTILDVIELLGSTSGLAGMAGGQMLDLKGSAEISSLQELEKIHSLKTGALIKFSVTAPTIIYNIEETKKEKLERYAEAVGLAFQIKDDILDVASSKEILGKTPGKDLAQNKATYVSILGLDKAKEYLEKMTEKAYTAVAFLGDNNILELLAKYLLERNN